MKSVCVFLALGLAGLGAGVTAAAEGAKGSATAPSAPGAGGPGSLSGVWFNNEFKTSAKFATAYQVQMTADGKMPPLQPWAAALLDQRIKDSEAGHPFPTTLSNCLPSGVPQMMFGPKDLPIQIVESPGQVTILFESLTTFRIIHLNEQHPPDPDPTFMGNSVGHWEGDTLVVDTIGLTDRTAIDTVGMPHSDALHLVERFRRTSKTTLELQVTFDDPKTFTQPWTAKTSFRAVPGARVEEYICENNRNRPDASGVSSGVQSSPNSR
jgi:hypothetical protein